MGRAPRLEPWEPAALLRLAERRWPVRPDEEVDPEPGRPSVIACVQALPPRQRLCLLGVYWGGLTAAEVAALCRTTPAAVRQCLKRALRGLRRVLSAPSAASR